MKKVFLPWGIELNFQKCKELLEEALKYTWTSSPWIPFMQLRNRKDDSVLFLYKDQYKPELHQKITEEDHVHCELCWTSISNFEGEENSGYRNTDEKSYLKWFCNNCYTKIIGTKDPLGSLKKYSRDVKAVEVTIDGKNFNNLSSFYDEIEKKLTHNLNWKIGRNLNAFNGVLRGGFGMHGYEEPLLLTWKHSEKSSQDLGWSETLNNLKQLAKNSHSKNKDYFNEEIQRATRKEGLTLYETILQIIKEHRHIEFIKE